MSEQKQQNKKAQIVDSENVPSPSSIHAELKEIDYPEEKERQKMRLEWNQSPGDPSREDLKVPKEATRVDSEPSVEQQSSVVLEEKEQSALLGDAKMRMLPKEEQQSQSPKVEQQSQSPKEAQQSPLPKEAQQSPLPKEAQQSPLPKEAQKSPLPKEAQQSPLPKEAQQSQSAKEEQQSLSSEKSALPAGVEKNVLPEGAKHAVVDKLRTLDIDLCMRDFTHEDQSPKEAQQSQSPKEAQQSQSAKEAQQSQSPKEAQQSQSPKEEQQSLLSEKSALPAGVEKNVLPEGAKNAVVDKLWTLGGAAVFVLIAIVFAVCANQFYGTQTLDSRSALQIFQDEFKRLQNDFPEQNRNLWLRSGKMLTNHLNKSHPDEPAMIILTAAQDAKRTLLCLGSGLAQTYAVALNSSWLVIHGPSQAQYDDSTAKLHIDEQLSSGFESKHRAAVLNHLETLPPGSLLILYKYCDHENAAYKNVALVFTVLLKDSSLKSDTPLPELEEKVRDFLWQQFIRSGTMRSHQEMDSDKLSGVWSRISHLVLPVLPVKRIEAGSCPFDHE